MKAKCINGIQFITYDHISYSHAHLAHQACAGGVRCIQLRLKQRPHAEWLSIAQEVRSVCDNFGATFIVNDNVEIALASKADGVHLGAEDMPVQRARELLGADKIIGGTINRISDLYALAELGVDYVGLGPFRFTSTKEKLSPLLGLEGVREVVAEALPLDMPVIVVGGVQVGDVESLMQLGAAGVAVSRAIWGAPDIVHAARQFVSKLEAVPSETLLFEGVQNG